MTQTQPLTYGDFVTPPFHHVHKATHSFDEVVSRLKKAIADEDMWLIHEIDPQGLLARGGITILPTRQLLFFHPRYMEQVLSIAPDAVIEAPLKLVVMTAPDGSVSVRHLDAASQFERYPGLDGLIEAFQPMFERLTSVVSTP